ncbi:hypothetical protein WME90_40945 [Sorangium sp. So ce375]|uniref:hypothetical protein n=1 Tax=Sorangium sp. So ce375 TaxID=3133306 RepID=UPI003F5B04A8
MGPSAAYKVEGLGDGVPASGGAEGCGQEQLSSLCSAPTMPFTSHAGGAEEAPTESKPWCIDRGDFLEAMSTVTLWRALELGELPHSTRVWREGLECWTPAGEVKALGWTISQPPPRDEAAALSAAGEGPESTGPLSFALTPDDLSAVAPRFHQGAPAKARDERAEAFTLGRFPLAEAVLRQDVPSQPISLEIPSCFPATPSSPPDTLPSAVAPRLGAARSGPARGARDADPTPRARVSGAWSRLARRARASRNAVSIAAGSAAIVLVLGLSVLSALAPEGAPAAASVALAARPGVAQGVAAAAAQVVLPSSQLAATLAVAAPAATPAFDGAPPEAIPALAASEATLAHDGVAPEATPALAAPEATLARDGVAPGATSTPGGAAPEATPAREEAAAAPGEGTGASALPPYGAEKALASGAKAAPVGRRERGQFRLRRGRSEADATRGISYPARRADSWIGTGAILRDSR